MAHLVLQTPMKRGEKILLTGSPNSSGSPVVSPSDTLVGVHTQSFYHSQPIADDAFSDEQVSLIL